MNEPRGRFACNTIGGKVLAIASDQPSGTYSSTAELYDPAIDAWTLVGSLTKGRWQHASAVLADGRAIVTGGYQDDITFGISSVEIYDPKTAKWTEAAPLKIPRHQHAMTAMADGRVLVVGGVEDPMLPSAERYDVATNTWNALPPPKDFHSPAAAVTLKDGRVLVIGGSADPEFLDAAGTAFTVTSALKVKRSGAALTALPDGTALITGGVDESEKALSSAELFDPKTNSWSLVGSMARARTEHATVVTSTGAVLIAGGEKSADVEMYDVANRTFAIIGHLAIPRSVMCAASLGDTALVLGGAQIGMYNAYTALVDRWQPSPGDAPCTLGLECASGACSGGKCTSSLFAPSDAGFDAAPTATPIAATNFQRCAKDAECGTGHCVEGVCCNTACTEQCHSCALPSSPGVCTPEPVGVDLKGECGAALSCTGTCGAESKCIGSGAGAQCGKSRCTSGNTGVGAVSCASAGARCPVDDAVPFSCGAYACEPAFGACLTSCRSSTDCAGGFVCDVPTGKCTAPTPAEDEGCSCTTPGHASGAPVALLLLLAFALARRRLT